MGVVFFAFIALAMLLGGVGLVILGVVLHVALKKRAQSGGRWAKRFRKLAGPAIVLGLLGAILPLGFFGFVIYENATPPDGFVETAIIIEEDGYQPERFTADGITYLRLPFNAASQRGEAVFTYKGAGWYNADEWGNYYRIENGIGCDLVSDRYSGLFCPEDQYDRVVDTYENTREEASIWFGPEQEIETSDELRAAFRAIQAMEGEGVRMRFAEGGFHMLSITERSFDGVVLHDSIPLLYTPKGVFLQRVYQIRDDHYTFHALELPGEISTLMEELYAGIQN